MITIRRFWIARIFIGLVTIINIQCAFVFMIYPGQFAPTFELSGISGRAAIQGFAILFLMWNVPYVVAFINPIKYRISLIEAICMQTIGLVGESLIIYTIPVDNFLLRGSIFRFIIFDFVGLLFLISAILITKSKDEHLLTRKI